MKRHKVCRLGDVMMRQGITQTELSEMTGLSQSHLSKIINGGDLYLTTAQIIAKSVGRKVDYIWPEYSWIEAR